MEAIEPRKLRPAQLARLLDSAPLGEVVQSHTIYRRRNRAGYRIWDGQIELEWLYDPCHEDYGPGAAHEARRCARQRDTGCRH